MRCIAIGLALMIGTAGALAGGTESSALGRTGLSSELDAADAENRVDVDAGVGSAERFEASIPADRAVPYPLAAPHRIEAARSLQGFAPSDATTLASDDFDGDGVPDLVCGYGGAGDPHLTLHRGNVDAIFPHTPAARQRRLDGAFTDEPFLGPAVVVPLPTRPDFLAAGDFDNDGHRDLVVVTRNASTLYFLSGDGRGGFAAPEAHHVDGPITAFVAGEVNRPDALVDLAVGIVGPTGPALVVFEGPDGALRAAPESLALPAPARAVALGDVVGDYTRDLVVALEGQVRIVHGRDRHLISAEKRRASVLPPAVDAVPFSPTVEAVSIGNFVDQPGARHEIALLASDGSLFVLGRDDDGGWNRRIERSIVAGSSPSPRSMVRARGSGARTDDLVVVDPPGRRVHLVRPVSGGSVSASLPGSPVAALPMRLGEDAVDDLVVLEEGAGVSVVEAAIEATIVVDTASETGTTGDGFCALSEAIINARSDADFSSGDCAAGAGNDLIHFDIAGGGSVATIVLAAGLGYPFISDPMTINGNTQGCPTPPCVDIDASLTTTAGLLLTGGSSTLRGLVVRNFPLSAVNIRSDGNFVEGCFVGTDQAGLVAAPNGGNGIEAINASQNTVGGTVAAARNVLSGNDSNGALFTGPASTDNLVLGNYIGINAPGTAILGNGAGGVIMLANASGNTVGGTTPGARNVLSGNVFSGVTYFQGAFGNLAIGNYIGTDAAGTLPLLNAQNGVLVREAANNAVGSTAAGARNVISGNNTDGIILFDVLVTDTIVAGNWIGIDAGGTAALGNGSDAIDVNDTPFNTIGGTTASARNVLSGNFQGIDIDELNSHDNEVLGNYIGIDPTGTFAIPNTDEGVQIDTGSFDNTIEANVVSGNVDDGIAVFDAGSDNNIIRGNLVGTDPSGTIKIPNGGDGIVVSTGPAGTTIGGTAPGDGNVVAGNGGYGVALFQSSSSDVVGNLIGTDVSGNVALGNGLSGVLIQDSANNTIGGTLVGAGNVLADSSENGIFLLGASATGNRILGNFIGVDETGTTLLGNDLAGVVVVDGSTDVGNGTSAGANVLAGNANHGVVVLGSGLARVKVNSIRDNGLLGIDLGNDLVTPNDPGDADAGPNNLQNFPLLASATVDLLAGTVTVSGDLDSSAGNFRLEFYSNAGCDDSGHGEGQHFLGTATVPVGSFGPLVFSPNPLPAANAITATAAKPGLGGGERSSEFSPCFDAACVSTVAFAQTIVAPDTDTLSWAGPSDIRFVKGDLATVGSYATLSEGALAAATALDISADNPAAGSGLYYLVRPAGCGSWQTQIGVEPARDVTLP